MRIGLFKILVISILGGISTLAEACDSAGATEKALRGALAVEQINGGGNPLTSEVYPYNSRIDTFGVILGYSGVQHIYAVKFVSNSCLISSISLSR